MAKKTAKKTPAKKTPAKKAPAKKAAKKATVEKAASKAPAKKASKKAAAEPLPEGVTMATVTLVTINDTNPVNLSIKDVSGTPQVYYGTILVSSEIDDIFDQNTSTTTVNWVVTNQASYAVDVQFGSGTPWITLNAAGSGGSGGGTTTHPMSMPAQGACASTNLYVRKDTSTIAHDPIIKIKRKDANGRIPNC